MSVCLFLFLFIFGRRQVTGDLYQSSESELSGSVSIWDSVSD